MNIKKLCLYFIIHTKLILLFSSLLFLCPGCTILFWGDTQKVEFNSEPEGVSVYDDSGALLGKTPLIAEVSRNTRRISFRKVGYERLDVSTERSFLWLPIILDCCTLIWPIPVADLVISIANESCYGLKEKHNVTLEPLLQIK